MTICDRLLLCGSRLCTSSNNATPLVYLVRLSTISTTFVTKVMGSTGDVESGLRAALASAPLTDAALGDVITNVLSIITDAIEPGGLMGMTISSSQCKENFLFKSRKRAIAIPGRIWYFPLRTTSQNQE